VPSVWVNVETRCPVRPDSTPDRPRWTGHPARAPVRPVHTGRARRGGPPSPIARLFPHARLDRITPPAIDPGQRPDPQPPTPPAGPAPTGRWGHRRRLRAGDQRLHAGPQPSRTSTSD